jgi:hypothetical protein
VRHQEDLATVVADLQRQVRELRRNSLFSAAITQGGLDVRTPGGNVIMRAGEFEYGSETAYGLTIFRTNGTMQASFFDTPSGSGYWAFFDEQGSIVASSDTVSGVGLALPYVPYHVMPYSEVLSPPQNTNSATFVPLHRVHGQRQNPRLRLLLLVDSDADTTGEVIVTDIGGTQIGGVLDVPLASNSYRWWDVTLPAGNHLDTQYLNVAARRTAGTGVVRVGVAWCAGVQS